MNIKNDYSFLFNSLNNTSSNNNSNNIFNAIDLSEYHSIKSGNYGKLLKAYYAKHADEASESSTTTDNKKQTLAEDTAVEKLTEVAAGAGTLEDSADKLITKGMDSLFKEKELTTKDETGKEQTIVGYDTDAIYNAVNDFTGKYNSFLKAVANSDSSKVERETDNLTAVVSGYTEALKEIGITINEDNTLSINKDTFKGADMDKVENLFNGNASLTYKVSTKASLIGMTANSEANSMKTYTSDGDYSTGFSSGSLLDSLI